MVGLTEMKAYISWSEKVWHPLPHCDFLIQPHQGIEKRWFWFKYVQFRRPEVRRFLAEVQLRSWARLFNFHSSLSNASHAISHSRSPRPSYSKFVNYIRIIQNDAKNTSWSAEGRCGLVVLRDCFQWKIFNMYCSAESSYTKSQRPRDNPCYPKISEGWCWVPRLVHSSRWIRSFGAKTLLYIGR